MKTLQITSPFIQLNQVLKMMNWVENGGDANKMISAGTVKVNGNVELRRRNKILPGMVVEFNGQIVEILGNASGDLG